MNADETVRILINDLKRFMREELARTLRQVTTGSPESVIEPVTGHPVIDPFTGQPLTRPVLEHIKTLHSQLAKAGLCDNREFHDALHELLLDAAAAPVFRLLAILDGESPLSNNVTLELRVKGGQTLPTHLHEILFPIDHDR